MPARKSDSFWTDAKEAELRQLVASDMKFTVDQIGLALRCSKNAVIGKCRRLKLILARDNGMRSDSPPKKPRVRRAIRIHGASAYGRPVVEAIEPAPPPKELPASDIPLEQRKSIFELTDQTCRYPYGQPGMDGFFFCGAIPVENSPYCCFHNRICFTQRASLGRTFIPMRVAK